MIKLKEIRKARGMTQAELAAKVRHADPTVDQTVISVLERGQLYPSESLRDALCDALGCTEAELYDGIEAFFVPSDDREFSETTKILAEIFTERTGKYKYISREYLRRLFCEKAGAKTDRDLRRAIERARQEGMVICNAQDGNGYFLPNTYEELDAQEKRNTSRAIAILRQNKFIRRRKKEMLA